MTRTTDREYWKQRNGVKQHTDADFIRRGKQQVAMQRVNQAKKNGTLIPSSSCEICGDECKTIAHHWKGYDFPFSVWWVCYSCNSNIPVHDGSWTKEQARRHIIKKLFEKPLHIATWFENTEHSCNVCGCLFSGAGGTIDYSEELCLCGRCSDNLRAR